ncbi:ATP-grasp domain-containing protein [Shewanella intestini]|uniref:ATP-grasp domain-containing protein n=1 Tax=Shewanella intestini TaxID=2017544 RepID=A0ABS5I033_9GAMM|nr:MULTISPECIES: ATP-grasp domain-containing protein [Shewanella]MBR9726730.1 ATP-grasp domain-containing protein [Shewanella intestini]MRG34704.1 ATP-grasp domain-containing protein [Shewanella sp. XMDDZSB0408]
MPYNKNLLIIGAGIEACEGIKTAQEMGLKLIIADGNPQAPGLEMADWQIIASTYDGNAILEQATALIKQGVAIHGVIAMCADVPMSVATITDALGLPGLSLESAFWVSDKLAMKDRLKAKGVPIPNYADVSDPSLLQVRAEKIGFPLIIKPVDSRGARGVQLIESHNMLNAAWELAVQESPTARVMLEEYLDGPQFSTETLIDNGKCHTLGFADRNYEWLSRSKPFIIENGGDSPTRASDRAKAEVITIVEGAAKALEITQGIVKGDMVYTNDGAKVIEVAGRLSGGFFSTTQIPLATGVNFIEKAIKLAMGDPLTLQEVTPNKARAVAIRYLDLPPGKVRAIHGVEQASQSEGVAMFKMFIDVGDVIPPLSNHTQRAGFAIASSSNRQEAINYALLALANIEIEYEA